jgi:hypothetical protein
VCIPKADRATAWLKNLLGDRPLASTWVVEPARLARIFKRTVDRNCQALGIVATKGRQTGGWTRSLPTALKWRSSEQAGECQELITGVPWASDRQRSKIAAERGTNWLAKSCANDVVTIVYYSVGVSSVGKPGRRDRCKGRALRSAEDEYARAGGWNRISPIGLHLRRADRITQIEIAQKRAERRNPHLILRRLTSCGVWECASQNRATPRSFYYEIQK